LTGRSGILWLDGQATNLKHRITAMDKYRVTLTTTLAAARQKLRKLYPSNEDG